MEVFISYTHIDNQPLTEGQPGWIAQFHKLLETRLAMLLGENPTVWRDLKLNRVDEFGDTIMDQLRRSNALVSVVSPRYLKSEWCVREATEFLKELGRPSDPNQPHRRYVKAIKTPVPKEVIPSVLGEAFNKILGFNFYRVDQETGRPREYDPEFGPEYKRLLLEQVYDLAYDLCRPPAKTAGGSGRTVYLATTTSDLQEERQRLARELQERGHAVLPEAPQPTSGADFEAAVLADLQRSDLAVHLVGGRYGLIPEDRTESVVELQNRLAAQRSAAANAFSRFLWLPRDQEIKDERQKAFVKRLFEDAEAQRGAEIVQDTVERLKGLVLAKLSPPPPPPAVAPPAPSGPARVYLICDKNDEGALLDAVEDHLFNQGIEVSRSPLEGSEAEVSALHRQQLQVCDGVLIYYGAASRGWVDMKLLDLAQAPGYGRTKPFRATCVCVGPPDDRNKSRFRTLVAEVARVTEPLDPAALAKFVQTLKGVPA